MEWSWYDMVLPGGGSSDKARRGLERLPLLGFKLALVGAGVLFFFSFLLHTVRILGSFSFLLFPFFQHTWGSSR